MASSNITVVTSITGGKDNLIEDQVKGDAQFIAYVDKSQFSSAWQLRKSYNRFLDERRNSRIHKILIHQYVTTEYSIWIDGNIRLLETPENIIKKYLQEHDFAVFKHPVRNCIYQESMTCAKRTLDDPETIIEQAKWYEDHGFAKDKGLYECGVLIRRHTPRVEAFNNAWWSEYCRFSKRDQISFVYAADKTGLRFNGINKQFMEKDGSLIRDDVVEIVPHEIPNIITI